jgi:protocatechuate 3,4-dioxygenase beta subunit
MGTYWLVSNSQLSDSCALLSLALLHFVWQGAILGLLAWMLNSAFVGSSARIRYATNLTLLCVMGCGMPLTLVELVQDQSPALSHSYSRALVQEHQQPEAGVQLANAAGIGNGHDLSYAILSAGTQSRVTQSDPQPMPNKTFRAVLPLALSVAYIAGVLMMARPSDRSALGTLLLTIVAAALMIWTALDFVPAKAAQQPEKDVPRVVGKVISVNVGRQVAISLGHGDGLEVGHILNTHRNGERVAETQVVELFANHSRGVASDPVEVGDTVQLQSTLSLKGKCVDENGNPLAKAIVRVFRYQPGDDTALPQLLATAQSDTTGAFEFDELRAIRLAFYGTDLFIAASLADHASVQQFIDARVVETTRLELRLSSEPGTLTGLVLDPDRNPVEGASVYVPGRAPSIPELWSGRTDAKGKFRISDLQVWSNDDKNARRSLIVSQSQYKQAAWYESIPQILNIKLQKPQLKGELLIALRANPSLVLSCRRRV